jgi:hypothetical protein
LRALAAIRRLPGVRRRDGDKLDVLAGACRAASFDPIGIAPLCDCELGHVQAELADTLACVLARFIAGARTLTGEPIQRSEDSGRPEGSAVQDRTDGVSSFVILAECSSALGRNRLGVNGACRIGGFHQAIIIFGDQ